MTGFRRSAGFAAGARAIVSVAERSRDAGNPHDPDVAIAMTRPVIEAASPFVALL